MFVVVIPAWEGAKCWETLKKSAFNRSHLHLTPLDHGFFEGSQHNSRTRYRHATTATSVFFLQTSAAKCRWPVTPEVLASLSSAFRSKVSAPSAKRTRNNAAEEGTDTLFGGDFSAPAAASKNPTGRSVRGAGKGAVESDADSDGSAEMVIEMDAGADVLGGSNSIPTQTQSKRDRPVHAKKRNRREITSSSSALQDDPYEGQVGIDSGRRLEQQEVRGEKEVIVKKAKLSAMSADGVTSGGELLGKKKRKSRPQNTGKFAPDGSMQDILRQVLCAAEASGKDVSGAMPRTDAVTRDGMSICEQAASSKASRSGKRRSSKEAKHANDDRPPGRHIEDDSGNARTGVREIDGGQGIASSSNCVVPVANGDTDVRSNGSQDRLNKGARTGQEKHGNVGVVSFGMSQSQKGKLAKRKSSIEFLKRERRRNPGLDKGGVRHPKVMHPYNE